MELLQHYKSFIESVPGTLVETNGHVVRETSEGLKPVVWVGKKVVLPTPEFLSNPNWDEYMAFHPMCESIARGESDAIQLAQTLVRISLWDHAIDAARALLQIAADQSLQTKLTPAQQKMLSTISEADATTLENFGKIIAKSRHEYSEGVDRRIIAIFLKRGGSQDGQHYSRMFVVRFPMYNELCKAEEAKDAKDRKVFDVQLRAKDIPILKALHETIFPGDESTYTIGTNSNLAPYYTVLLNGYANMARQLNSVMKPFIKSVKTLKLISLDWDEGDNLTVFRNKIPALPHNEGNDPVADANTPQPTTAQPVMAQPVMQQPVQQQPAMQPSTLGSYNPAPVQIGTPAPAPTQAAAGGSKAPSGGAVSWSELNKSAPGMQQPMMQYGYQQPGMMMPQQPGMMMQPQQFMQPGQPMMPQQQFIQQPMMPQQNMGYQPVMANGMPQPPMPPVSQPVQQPQQQFIQQPMMPQQMYMQPQQQFVQPQQQFYQQPQQFVQQPGMIQPGMAQPFRFV